MNPMYGLALDGYGPPLEPPDGYYFLTNEQQAAQEAAEQEKDEADEGTDGPGGTPGHPGHALE